MVWKVILSVLFFIFVVLLLALYWFFPFSNSEFVFTGNNNFSLNLENSKMQFYDNMRFPDSLISYDIEGCPLAKEDEMEQAFRVVESKTILNFYLKPKNPEIVVTCDSKNRVEGDLFIAGEGGPTNITKSGDFALIHNGQILLLRQSNCDQPNVPIHELMHVLGFNHSNNPENVMYPVNQCGQTLSQDMLDLINELYSIKSAPDLLFTGASASRHGKYFDLNFTIVNYGLKPSLDSDVEIYADNDLIKTIGINSLEPGSGKTISFTNLYSSKMGVNYLEFNVEYLFDELKKENNRIRLEVVDS